MNNQLQRNIPVLYLFSFFWLAMVILPVLVPFFATRGLDLTEVFFLQAIFAFFVVLFEVPSGYVADLYGRKRALMVGSIFHAAGFTWLIFAHGFLELVVFELLLAVGLSLLSGADLSLLYDSQEALRQTPREKTRGIANMRFAKSIAEGCAALLGGALVVFSFDVMVLVNAVLAFVPLGLSFLLVEAPFQKMQSAAPGVHLKRILGHLLVQDKLLRLTCINIVFFSLATFYVVWLLQPYWEAEGVSLVWFGVLWAAQSFLFALASKVSVPMEERFGPIVVLSIMGVLPAVGYFVMSTVGGVIGIAFSFAFFVSRGFNQVILTDALNKRVPSEFRATANSLTSFAFRGVYIVTGPIVGLLVGGLGMKTTLFILGIASVGLLLVCLVPLMRAIGESTSEEGQLASRRG